MPADFNDRTDFENADRGFIASIEPMTISDAQGRQIWDMDGWAFLESTCPETANASLWRQSQLNCRHGLYEVTEGIYQVRGFDLSNMTLVESDHGVIVIDPLISQETAAAALALYRSHRGDRAVTAVIYTHAHIDHFGGVLGVVDADTEVPILAPEHFLEHAVSENVYAGTAMLRRGYYYGGVALPKAAKGTLGMGLGPAASTGTVGLIAPTLDITRTGQEEVLDGVRIVFQNTPGTECPSEMNFYFPDHKALCLAENATHNLHNLLTLRGAQVRDPRIWSRYLSEAMELFARQSDVAFASHHWPTWGSDNIVTFLAEQRDLYSYLHDQTLRLINQGYVGSEIAEMLDMPPGLDEAWNTHGYYGSANHNVKAIYQRYLGWYDGNPAHLWQHPPVAAAERYVKVIGGVDATVAKAITFLEKGDLRFAAELASHAVFAAPDSETARQVLCTALTELGYGSECATWRNCFLIGARELFHEIEHTEVSSAGMAPALTVTQLFDSIAIRINGPKAWGEQLRINWTVTGDEAGGSGSGSGSGSGHYRMELSNGALIHFPTALREEADLTVTLTKAQLVGLLLQGQTGGVEMSGEPGVLATLVGLLDTPDPDFAVVTP